MGSGAWRFVNWKTFRWALALILALGWSVPPRSVLAQASADRSSSQVAAKARNHPTAIPEARLTLRVYNYARVDPVSLTSSERVAGAVFESVGIQAVWVDCPTSPQKSQAYPACDSEMGTTDLILRILPRRMAVKLRRSNDSLGSAQTCPETEPACELTVFYHRVDELAANGYRADLILGHVIAHEVAHVLLGPRHSDEGILRAAWSPSDLQRISLGMHLDFSTDQSRQLRLAVVRRTTPPTQGITIQANLIAR